MFCHIYGPNNNRKCAEWADDMGSETFEGIVCPANKGHQRAGKRLTDLSVELPGNDAEDFIWTGISECLIQDRVLSFLREQRFTGFDVKPVNARFKDKSADPPPKLWELVVTGWAGFASPESGIRLTYRCEACGQAKYSGLSNPQHLIDEKRWDGSDFFIIWPLPKYVFVTDRVRDAINAQGFTGVRFVASNQLEPTDGYTPGRLSYYMPDLRAHEIGEPLGIY
jgi:Protein of unknown function (Gmx_para_CXXCG)